MIACCCDQRKIGRVASLQARIALPCCRSRIAESADAQDSQEGISGDGRVRPLRRTGDIDDEANHVLTSRLGSVEIGAVKAHDITKRAGVATHAGE